MGNEHLAAEAVASKVLGLAPKLTPADIEAVIVGEHYFTADQGIAGALAMNQGRSRFFAPSSGGMERVTYCVLELRNGAKVTGVNHGPVSAANFDAAKGREYARENAIEKVWELEGYALRERLAAPVVSASFLLNATPEQEADLLEKLRKAPSAGIFLTALDTDAGTAVAALLQAAEAMRAFTDPEGNMPADTGEFNDLKEALAVAEGVLAGNAQAMDGGPNPHYDPDADKGAQLLDIMRAFVDLYRVSCPETIHQTDRVIEKAGGLVEKLCDVAGYYRDPDDEAEEAQP